MPPKRSSKSKSPSPRKASPGKKSSPDAGTKAAEIGKRKREESKNTDDNSNAAQTLAEQKTRIKSGAEAQKLPGIGESTAGKIDEFLKTGKMEKVERLATTQPRYWRIWRGCRDWPCSSWELYDQGIRSIEDLKKHPDLLPEQLQKPVKNLDAIESPINKQQADKIKKYLEQQLKGLDGRFKVTLCGACRRHEATVMELVAVITHSAKKTKDLLHELTEKLKHSGFLPETMTEGNHRVKGICQLPAAHSPKKPERSRPQRSSPRKKAKKEDDVSAADEEKHGEQHMLLL
ncbi:DNA polymerase beta-like [Paramacrobiotus metropolitanus]|uniref:DNA polymerase beta-like n=1 Tax=Paramacrobiotus metropolitanus TaxID=2943436 RepID=UPI002445FDD0|nr:DNA polymerase beta-like [Paramacrobiotus metropolitanus]